MHRRKSATKRTEREPCGGQRQEFWDLRVERPVPTLSLSCGTLGRSLT